jgi:hypothetical protein
LKRFLIRPRPATDFEVLKAIHDHHRSDYIAGHKAVGRSKTFLPIDIPTIAGRLEIDNDSVFGRLHHHLETKYGAEGADGQPNKSLFVRQLNDVPNCINFPLLESVLASLWVERRRELRTFGLSLASIGIAIASLLVSIATG